MEKKKVTTLKINFDDKQQRRNFVLWLSESGEGEYHSWTQSQIDGGTFNTDPLYDYENCEFVDYLSPVIDGDGDIWDETEWVEDEEGYDEYE